MNRRRLFPNVLHDVDFAASGPRHLLNVVAQKPKRWPHALTARQFDPSGKAAISLRKDRARDQPGRRVLAGDSVHARIVLETRFDDHLAPFYAGVHGTILVVLEFAISPAVAANFELPF